MSENHNEHKEPLWILIEKQIQTYDEGDFIEENILATSRKIAEELDKTGYNVSKHGGNWMKLTAAVKARNRVGRPFMEDFNQALTALVLDDIKDSHATAMKIMRDLGRDWPSLLTSEHGADVDKIVESIRIDLIIAMAKELSGEPGIRYLMTESFEPQAIMEALGVSEEEYKSVKSKLDAELAEKARVKHLFADMEESSEEDKIKHLLNKNVADELITEIGGIKQSAIDTVKKAMEKRASGKEKKRRRTGS